MGCLYSKQSPSSQGAKSSVAYENIAQSNQTSAESKKQTHSPQQCTWSYLGQKSKEKKEVDFSKLKAEDFLLSGFQDRVIIRKQGEILGQAMNIDKCSNCDFYLLDNSSQIFIDSCENCRFFIGPCSGSIFIRTSTNVKMIVACQQFRTRDCKNLELSMFCSTRPVIESSSDITFSCFGSNYIGLAQQFHEADLSVYNNHWNVVHDFTPQANNYKFVSNRFKITDWMKPLHTLDIGITEDEENQNEKSCPVPPTRRREDVPSNVIMFLPGCYNDAEQFMPQIMTEIYQTKEHKFSKPEIDILFDKTENSSSLKQEATKGPVIVIGTNLSSMELRTKASQIVAPESFYVPASENEASYMANYLFNIHRVEV
ncbi:hypothetical protein FDP41_008205 [Naegleria fowleri]|uniref:C-CAP/cofactor C-like domain-containing protein n=1 Tax=Naegleria fowleri TaxID=5763 RepID=A0A6A5BG94_NAEFO|nr:uncharacterized protein FDP41_008205 [Naegleria fowleri]KAF0973501.1 hypothetical protein FDP41_008205 [Naegleria fowleri]